MRTIKNLLKLVLVAVLSLAFAISVAACNTGSKPGNDLPGGNTGTPPNEGDEIGRAHV